MQRRLTAILSADVAGYSSLMEADEAGTLERLKINRSQIFDPCIAAHGGRTVKLMGDGALVEFSSVVAAVNCGLAIQAASARAEPDSSKGEAIRYRIGINLGDVIVEGDDIYGDGVNIAARLQALAPVGGVAVSLTVRDQVGGKASCAFEDLGEFTVKNIDRPVRVFAVHPAAVTEHEKAAVTARTRVSMCVLPFTNISGDPEQEYFSDGITEDIITDLSKVSALWVASHHTTFAFKGKQVNILEVARQLKVGHVLEGSVRKSGSRVRITAQLIDGATGGHIWAERYDRDLNDIFSLQDEISLAIVTALKLQLLPEEKRSIEQRGTANAHAYRLYLMARQYSVTGNRGTARCSQAIIRLCRRATELDPNYARCWALMAFEQTTSRLYLGDSDDGLAAAERAVALDPNLAEAHAARGRVLTQHRRFDEAGSEIAIALSLDPEGYEVNYVAGRWNFSQRRLPEAIRYWEKAAIAMETDYLAASNLVTCYRAIRDVEGTRRVAQLVVARTEKIGAREPDNGSVLGAGVLALAVLGEVERAKEWTERGMLLDPDNRRMQYDLACAHVEMHEFEAALDLLGPLFETYTIEALDWAKVDPDLDPIRDHSRFKVALASAETRLAQS
jgi:adenylate cyclase